MLSTRSMATRRDEVESSVLPDPSTYPNPSIYPNPPPSNLSFMTNSGIKIRAFQTIELQLQHIAQDLPDYATKSCYDDAVSHV